MIRNAAVVRTDVKVTACALLLWTLLCVTLPDVAHAADASPPPAPATTAGDAGSGDQTETSEQTAKPGRPLSGSEARQANDKGGVFRPSEDISEDLGVTFPVDI